MQFRGVLLCNFAAFYYAISQYHHTGGAEGALVFGYDYHDSVGLDQNWIGVIVLHDCPACRGSVSDYAAVCPKCGHPVRTKRVLESPEVTETVESADCARNRKPDHNDPNCRGCEHFRRKMKYRNCPDCRHYATMREENYWDGDVVTHWCRKMREHPDFERCDDPDKPESPYFQDTCHLELKKLVVTQKAKYQWIYY